MNWLVWMDNFWRRREEREGMVYKLEKKRRNRVQFEFVLQWNGEVHISIRVRLESCMKEENGNAFRVE